MRVLELTQRFPPAIGGVEQHVSHLAEALSRAGVEVEVLTTDLSRDTPFARFDSIPPPGAFPVTRLRAWKFLEAPHGLGILAPSMLSATAASNADVIHAHGYGRFPTFAGNLGSALDGAALVVTTHSDAGRPTWAKRLFDSIVPGLTLSQARRVIAVSQHEAGHLSRLGVPREKIRVVPNGVDISEFEGLADARSPSDCITGLFVGRIDPDQKGLLTLVHAIALLPRNLPIRIRLVGEDWGGITLLRSAAERGAVTDRLTFVGRLDRAALIKEYAAADFLVLPSRFEPFGIVLLEAMASGLPVVASRVGGIPEVVVDGETGILVEPGNASEIASAILRLAESPALRARMGACGRERARSYSWDALVPRILAVYREALQEGA